MSLTNFQGSADQIGESEGSESFGDVRPQENWTEVHSSPLQLPETWLRPTGRGVRQSALPLGQARLRLENTDFNVLPDIGFVAESEEENRRRIYRLRLYAKPHFAGPADVSIQFLDRSGSPFTDQTSGPSRQSGLPSQVITFTPLQVAPVEELDLRVVRGLQKDVVTACCQWTVPRKLRGVSACRVLVRPLSQGAEPHQVQRRRSDVALGRQASASEYGFLLEPSHFQILWARLTEMLFEQPNCGARVKDARDRDDATQIAIDSYLNSLLRGTHTPLLSAAEWDEPARKYLRAIFVKAGTTASHQRRGTRAKSAASAASLDGAAPDPGRPNMVVSSALAEHAAAAVAASPQGDPLTLAVASIEDLPYDDFEQFLADVKTLVSQLGDQAQRIFTLRTMQQLSIGEIAEALSLRPVTVRVSLCRSKKWLREALRRKMEE